MLLLFMSVVKDPVLLTGNIPWKPPVGCPFTGRQVVGLRPTICALSAVTPNGLLTGSVACAAFTALQASIRLTVAPAPAVVAGSICWTGFPTVYRCCS